MRPGDMMETIEFNSRAESGNIFFVLCLAQRAMKKEHRIIEYNDMRDDVLSCSDYEEALQIIGKHVSLYDTATGKLYSKEGPRNRRVRKEEKENI